MIDENITWEDHIHKIEKKTCKKSRVIISSKTHT